MPRRRIALLRPRGRTSWSALPAKFSGLFLLSFSLANHVMCEAFSMTLSPGRIYVNNKANATLITADTSTVQWQNPMPTSLQKTAYEIASSFVPDTSFDPPSWTQNCHVQTIGGFFLRGTPAAYLPRNRPLITAQRLWRGLATGRGPSTGTRSSGVAEEEFGWDTRERILTPDEDFFDVDTKYAGNGNDSAPLVILLHGLESNSDSDLSKQLAQACVQAGFSCACINFRSCSMDPDGTPIPNAKLWGYHLGFTDDLMQYLEICRERRPYQKRYLMGFSLGANAALKALGELGEDALEKYNIRGGALLCTPFDQERNAEALAQPGINRMIYTNSLLKSLKGKAQEKLDDFCNGDTETSVFDYKKAMEAEIISDFDEAFIAPIYNFRDCWDYYRKTSSIYYMENVTVPVYSINAADDPFFDNSVFPVDRTIGNGGRAPMVMQQVKSGGHLGFCFHQVEENDPRLSVHGPSWSPVEAVRFLTHVHEHPVQLRNWYF